MKICYFGSDYPPTGGGIATYVIEMLRAVTSSTVITSMPMYIFGNAEPRQELLTNKIQVTTFATRNFFIIGLLVLRKIWANRDAHLFHALYVFPVGFWVVCWSKLFGKSSVVTIYGTDICSKEGNYVTRWMKRFAINFADRIISISHFTKHAVARSLALSHVVQDRIVVIYPTVPMVQTDKNEDEIKKAVDTLKRELSLPSDVFPVLSVCRLVARKGVEYLIEAITYISDPRVVLLIAGGGPEKDRFEGLVRRYRLQNRVFLLGKVPDLVPLYRLAKIGILASFSRIAEGDFEGLGLVLLEAQSFGLPVIGTNSGGISETFIDGETGILVPEQDAGALARALLRLHTDTTSYASMSRATHALLVGRFSKDRMVTEYLNLIQSIK